MTVRGGRAEGSQNDEDSEGNEEHDPASNI